MKRVASTILVSVLLLPALTLGAPSAPERRMNPNEISALPSFVKRVEPAIVALHVRNDEHAVSSTRLGSRRFGSGVVFDPRGYVLTVSYLLLDAVGVEARGRDGRTIAARVVGLDSLRLGEAPHANLAIPVERFVPVKDELIASGRIASRPPRPWLGLYTVTLPEGVVVSELSPIGPALRAGFRRGDRIVRVN